MRPAPAAGFSPRFRRSWSKRVDSLALAACLVVGWLTPQGQPAATTDTGNLDESTETSGVLLAQTVAGRPFQPGTDYEVVLEPQPTNSPDGAIEVAELFWYGAETSYRFQAVLAEWKKQAPAYVNVVRIPVLWCTRENGQAVRQRSFGPVCENVQNPVMVTHALAYFVAESLGKAEELHPAIYRGIHELGLSLTSGAELRALFSRYGVDAQSFDSAFGSFAVSIKARSADEAAYRYRITSIPAIVVAGRYVVRPAGSYERMMSIVSYLVETERGQRRADVPTRPSTGFHLGALQGEADEPRALRAL